MCRITLRSRLPDVAANLAPARITVGEDERAGRWWWESANQECGLHDGSSAIPFKPINRLATAAGNQNSMNKPLLNRLMCWLHNRQKWNTLKTIAVICVALLATLSITDAIAAGDTQLIKFHGAYQEDDRDLRLKRQERKLEPAYEFMIRVRVPGGDLNATNNGLNLRKLQITTRIKPYALPRAKPFNFTAF